MTMELTVDLFADLAVRALKMEAKLVNVSNRSESYRECLFLIRRVRTRLGKVIHHFVSPCQVALENRKAAEIEALMDIGALSEFHLFALGVIETVEGYLVDNS